MKYNLKNHRCEAYFEWKKVKDFAAGVQKCMECGEFVVKFAKQYIGYMFLKAQKGKGIIANMQNLPKINSQVNNRIILAYIFSRTKDKR